jgi:hypothetical protein
VGIYSFYGLKRGYQFLGGEGQCREKMMKFSV